jgi:hypothetical protein
MQLAARQNVCDCIKHSSRVFDHPIGEVEMNYSLVRELLLRFVRLLKEWLICCVAENVLHPRVQCSE